MEWTFREDTPIYTQLCEFLTMAIVSGELQPGQRLTTVRELAADAGVNPNTAQRAVAELERRGLVYSRRTVGRFVTEDAERIESERQALAEEHGRAFLAAMERLGFNRIQTVMLLEKLRAEAGA
ncbi:MAG: GntR family transcriptional regulator [Ruminococcaceae bacterium]|nr:GntR family transcriptional regulator [Oscillospiraceae bacterium]